MNTPPGKGRASSILRLVALGFFGAAAMVGLATAVYFNRGTVLRGGSPSFHGEVQSGVLEGGVEGQLGASAPLGSQVSEALGSGSVMWNRVPSRVVRRTFVDVESGAEVLEESAYFDVGEGEGEELAAALEKEGRVDDVLLVRKHRLGQSGKGGEVEEAAAVPSAGKPATVAAAAAAAAAAGVAAAPAAVGSGKRPPAPPVQVVAPPAAPAPAPASIPSAWSPLAIPTRPTDWVGPQRVVVGERESSQPEHASLEVNKISSLVPPPAFTTLPPGDALELSNRIVVAVALGVHSGSLRVGTPGDRVALGATPIIKVMLNTFLPTAQPHYLYRFYFAFDHNDPVYEVKENRDALAAMYAERVAEEDALRWHPPGLGAKAIDGSRLVVSMHWVHCDYSGKPGWAHSDAAVAAVREGADYVYRTNDDSEFPKIGDWLDRWVIELRSRSPVPNIGVTGPTCNEGATWILTHDFTHRSHVAIFGFQYPRSLPDWSSDDWVTYVYSAFGLQTKIVETVVGHTFVLGTRYEPTNKNARLAALNSELQDGAKKLSAWLLDNKKVTIPYQVKNVDCC